MTRTCHAGLWQRMFFLKTHIFDIYFAQRHTTTIQVKLQRRVFQCLKTLHPDWSRTYDLVFLRRMRRHLATQPGRKKAHLARERRAQRCKQATTMYTCCCLPPKIRFKTIASNNVLYIGYLDATCCYSPETG
jgi:hypothetical protein